MELDKLTIELRSIIKLEDCLTRNCRLYPLINKNDKTPSWDGEVIVYNSSSKTKNNIYGKTPLQVKGSVKKDLTKTKIKYSFSSSDFKNYKDEGIIIFVVYMKNYDEYKIYYKTLLPFDLHRLVKNIKKQKTKTIELKEFPKDNQSEVTNIFINFINNQKLQVGTIDDRILSIDDMDKLGIKASRFYFNYKIVNPSNFKQLIQNSSKQETYIYVKPDGFNVKIPIDKIDKIEEVVSKISTSIEVDNEVYYKDYKVITRENEEIIVIGNSLELNMNTGVLHYEFRGTLSQRIKDVKFLIELLNNKKVKIGGINFPNVRVNTCSKKIDDIKKELNRLEVIQKLLVDVLEIKDDLDLNNLSETDWYNLICLINSVMYGEIVTVEIRNKRKCKFENFVDKNFHIGILKICNLNIKLIFIEYEKDKYQIFNFFSDKNVSISIIDDNDELINISLYTLLEKEDFLIASNMNYSYIINSFRNMPKSELQNNLYNSLVLEILKAYDEQEKKNINLLNLAEKIILLLLKENNLDLNLKLNKFQIIKRKRNFNLEEIQDLCEMKVATENKMILLGINILLDNFNEASFYYDKLLEKEQKEFGQYPIINLWNKNIDCYKK